MRTRTFWNQPNFRLLGAALALALAAGCQSPKSDAPAAPTMSSTTSAAPATPSAPTAMTATPEASTAPAAPSAPSGVKLPIRIKAGSSAQMTDAEGNVWLPDQGFADGETTDRPDDMQISNTKSPALYRNEHYSMTSFSYPLPNGKYTVKLHFAETFDGITGAGERVFSYNVAGHQFNDLDIYAKTGGPQRAYIETVPVEVTDGKLHITFTQKVENPEINGIEILPPQ